jgi:hypothetical protein
MGEKPVCDEAARLAGIVETEAYSQPFEAHVAIAQIVAREAESRHMDICQLSERTNFVSVWLYAEAHPESWHAARFAAPEDWAILLAGLVLTGALPDATHDARHFDGADHAEPALWQSGQIRFFR